MWQPLETKGLKILETFDLNDPNNVGRSFYFNLDLYIAAIEMMICSDELDNALKMLDMVPGWHRQNYPKELTEIRNLLYKNMYDSYQYSSEQAIETPEWTKEDAIKKGKSSYFYPRADLLAKRISDLNDKGITPWICELSPSHGAMILAMINHGLKFTYFAKNINHHATDLLKSWIDEGVWSESHSTHNIFVYFEALEHMYHSEDLAHIYAKIGVSFDEAFLSTPFGTLGGGLPNWKTRPLGHVRTFTEREFYEIVSKCIPDLKWQLHRGHSMVLVGTNDRASQL